MKKVDKLTSRQVVTELRRNRLRERLLLGGCTPQELAEGEGIPLTQIHKDIRALAQGGILEQSKEATRLAYIQFSGEVDWTIEEARRLHRESFKDREDGEIEGGRLDCLHFISSKRKEEIETAQKLGLLELTEGKSEVTHKLDVNDPELVKKFGDYLATIKPSD